MQNKISLQRILFVLFCIILACCIVAWRLFTLGWYQHALYSEIARSQADGVRNVLMRGNIYAVDAKQQEHLVATNKKFATLLIEPLKIPDQFVDSTLATLASISGIDRDSVREVLNVRASGARVVQKKLTDEQVRLVTKASLNGVTVGYETDRTYPLGVFASDVIGFLGYSQDGRSGQYGVEESYDAHLTGHAPRASKFRWNVGDQIRKLFGMKPEVEVPEDGPEDVLLTIDPAIQEHAQLVLRSVLSKYQAASGTLIVQEPQSGKILAMVDSPSFNPNQYNKEPTQSFRNGALMAFEPGSSMKPFTIALGIEKHLITPDTTFNDNGDVIVDGFNIKNYNEGHFGIVTMTRVLEKSINTGVMWVQQKIGNQDFRDGIVNFGFGQQTSVDLPGESSGDIGNLYKDNRIYFMTASFGQGITVTPLQLISGYSAIANGGNLMRPYVVEATRDSHGVIRKTEPQIMGTPISPTTASLLRGMLTSVVDNGFDKARISRYDVAGKTGTAQIASPDGGYLEQQYNHSFVGFAPASNPKFVILIKMERPQGITFASDSLSSSFRDMAQFLLNYLGIAPTRP